MPLPKALELQLREEIVQMEMRQAKPYVSLIERLAQQAGREEGGEEGGEEGAVHLLLRHRFDPVPESVTLQLQSLTPAQLEALVDVALHQPTVTVT